MTSKTDTEVIIGGRVLTLSGMKVKNICRKLHYISTIRSRSIKRSRALSGSQRIRSVS
jgi:hypothetical protein